MSLSKAWREVLEHLYVNLYSGIYIVFNNRRCPTCVVKSKDGLLDVRSIRYGNTGYNYILYAQLDIIIWYKHNKK